MFAEEEKSDVAIYIQMILIQMVRESQMELAEQHSSSVMTIKTARDAWEKIVNSYIAQQKKKNILKQEGNFQTMLLIWLSGL